VASENHSIGEQQQIFVGRHGNWRPVVRVLELRTWENYNETTCDHKHTHADTQPQTKVAQTTGTKHSSGTLFDWVIPKLLKIKVLCKKKKKVCIQQRKLMLLAG